MIKLLIGGSPCTHWSIAQKNNRETKAEGEGWELFKNYLIAKEKFKPDYFLYENNKSAAQPIKDQIAKELGVWDGSLLSPDNNVRFTYINSALVSAQNRQRFYVTNFGEIEQPQDRGILLRDILESGVVDHEKAYCLKHQAGNARDYFKKHHTNIAFEPVVPSTVLNVNPNENGINGNVVHVNGKSLVLTTNKGESPKIIEPACVAQRGRYSDTGNRYAKTDAPTKQYYEARKDGKTNTLTTVQKDNMVAEPIRIGDMGSKSQGNRIYSLCGKCICLSANGGGKGAKTGLYAIPINDVEVKYHSIYEVRNGYITIKDMQYPIKLSDGFYIIRKLTVNECRRLQTIPEWYYMPCSDTQNYKMLGNGWTVEVIKHLLSHIPYIKNEEIVVLSMYDGMSCGQIALKDMGCNIKAYYAIEIDKYCIQTTQVNFPGTIQLGDAYQFREYKKVINY